jgi:hypothetical protein
MPALEQIPCQHGQILLDADSSLEDVFFPDSGVISVVAVYEDGSIIEMATWEAPERDCPCFRHPEFLWLRQ